MTILSVENKERLEAGRPLKTSGAESSSRARIDRGRRADLTSIVCFTSVFLVACGIYFLYLGDHPLFNPDEALYSEPAREMLESGDYVTTYMNYVVRYTKPPLTIWAQAGAMYLLGATEFASRLLSAACGAILVGITYLFGEKYVGRRPALFSALALATAPLFMGASRLSITDIPLAFFIAGSIMSLFHGFQTKENRWKWIGYVLLGLGVMTKGPVALVLPAGVLGLYHAATGEIRRAWSYYNPIAGLAVVTLIAIPWFALEIYVTKGEYYHAFLVRENFERFTSVVDHKYGWWYHPVAMLGGFFPWTIFLVVASVSYLSKTLRHIRSQKTSVGSNSNNDWLTTAKIQAQTYDRWIQNLEIRQRTVLLCTIAVAVILVFFSISVSKLLPYTLPAFPFLAVILGVQLDNLIKKEEEEEETTRTTSTPTPAARSAAMLSTTSTAQEVAGSAFTSISSVAGERGPERSHPAHSERSNKGLDDHSQSPPHSYEKLESIYKDSRSKRGWHPVTISFCILTVAALGGLLVPTLLQHKLRDCPPDLLTLIPTAVTTLAIVCGAGLLVSFKSATKALATFYLGFLMILGVFGPKVLDVIAAEWENPMIEFVQFAAVSDRPILIHAMRKPSATFYARRQVIIPQNRDDLVAQLSTMKDAYIVTRKHEADFVKTIPGCRVYAEKGTFTLVSYHSPKAGI